MKSVDIGVGTAGIGAWLTEGGFKTAEEYPVVTNKSKELDCCCGEGDERNLILLLEGWCEVSGVTHGLLARVLLGVQEDTKTAIALLTPEVNDYIIIPHMIIK